MYILILPAFGIFSEVTATFAGKRMFGYRSRWSGPAPRSPSSAAVWLHHFFTMGTGGDVNGFFGVATMLISIPHREAVQLADHHLQGPPALQHADPVDPGLRW